MAATPRRPRTSATQRDEPDQVLRREHLAERNERADAGSRVADEAAPGRRARGRSRPREPRGPRARRAVVNAARPPWPAIPTECWAVIAFGWPNVVSSEATRLSIWIGRDTWPQTLSPEPVWPEHRERHDHGGRRPGPDDDAAEELASPSPPERPDGGERQQDDREELRREGEREGQPPEPVAVAHERRHAGCDEHGRPEVEPRQHERPDDQREIATKAIPRAGARASITSPSVARPHTSISRANQRS